jgi:hypothetical protein
MVMDKLHELQFLIIYTMQFVTIQSKQLIFNYYAIPL